MHVFFAAAVFLSGVGAKTVSHRCCHCSYFHDGKIKAVSMALSVLVVIEMLNALNALSEDGSLVHMPPWCNPWLLVAIVASLGLHCVIMYFPMLATLFEITALDYKVCAVHVCVCVGDRALSVFLSGCSCALTYCHMSRRRCQDWVIVVLFSLPVIFIDEFLKLIGRINATAELNRRLKEQKSH